MGGVDEGNRESLPVIVFYEKVRKVLFAHSVPAKVVQPQLLKQMARDLDDMGLKKVIYKSDKEHPITALLNALRVEWTGELVPETAALGPQVTPFCISGK